MIAHYTEIRVDDSLNLGSVSLWKWQLEATGVRFARRFTSVHPDTINFRPSSSWWCGGLFGYVWSGLVLKPISSDKSLGWRKLDPIKAITCSGGDFTTITQKDMPLTIFFRTILPLTSRWQIGWTVGELVSRLFSNIGKYLSEEEITTIEDCRLEQLLLYFWKSDRSVTVFVVFEVNH